MPNHAGHKEYLSTTGIGGIKRLWGQQKEILRLVASGLYRNAEIAEMLGVTPGTVSKIIHSALGKQTLDMLEGAADADTVDLMVRIRSLAPIALSIQEDILMDDNTKVGMKNKIADKILDRAGYPAMTKNLNINANVGLTAGDLAAIKNRASELVEIQKVKDAEVVE